MDVTGWTQWTCPELPTAPLPISGFRVQVPGQSPKYGGFKRVNVQVLCQETPLTATYCKRGLFLQLPSGELQASVEIDDGWRVLDEVPSDLQAIEYEHDSDDAVWQKRITELVAAVGYLGWHEIVDVRIGEEAPHLLLTFSNGQTLYINGHDDRYESWNIAAGSVAVGNHFLVVAGPADELAIWCPEEVLAQVQSREG